MTGVDDGTLLVTVDEDIDRDVVTDLNWDGVVNRETHRLNDRHISNVSEETIRLRV